MDQIEEEQIYFHCMFRNGEKLKVKSFIYIFETGRNSPTVCVHVTQTSGLSSRVHTVKQCGLTYRKQWVVITGIASDRTTITSGHPLSSVLGPILFTIHVNYIILDLTLLLQNLLTIQKKKKNWKFDNRWPRHVKLPGIFAEIIRVV